MAESKVMVDYTHQVFLIRVRKRSFNWTMPHHPIEKSNQAMGTGFYLRYKKNIHLVTCFHVIKEAFLITISSPSIGSQEYPCRVRWICPRLDLAVLEIDYSKIASSKDEKNNLLHPRKAFRAWEFSEQKGRIEGPMIGEITTVLGYPLGQSNMKITSGILSGQQMGLYQTDAPINGGNSGGPLVWKERVIGINSSGYFLAQNIAYAIPVQSLLRLIDFHERHPSVYLIRFPRTWGMELCPPASQLLPHSNSKNVCNNKDCGLEIKQVFRHQLMEHAPLKDTDILLRINGMPISALGELPLTWLNQRMTIHNYFHHIHLGQKIRLEYMSGNKKKTAVVIVAPESDAVRYREWYEEHEEIPYLYLAGIVLVPLAKNCIDMRYRLLKSIDDDKNEEEENPFLNPTVDSNDPTLIRWIQPQNWHKGRLLISNILNGGLLYDTHILKIGDLIETIDGTVVETIAQAKTIVDRLRRQNKDVRIETMKGNVIHLSPTIIASEEQKLATVYNYSLPEETTKKKSLDKKKT